MRADAIIIAYNAVLLLFVAGQLALLQWVEPRRRPTAFVLSGAVLVLTSLFGAFASPIAGFGRIQLLAWAVFAYYPAFLLGATAALLQQRRRLALASLVLAVLLLSVAADAFLIEPQWLAVDHVTIRSSKLDTSVRVAVVADIQTDDPGRYEERVLERVRDADPDMILLTGDYVHLADAERYAAAAETLNQIFREAELEAPLGMYAVRGNVDLANGWREVLAGLPVTTFERSQTIEVGPLMLTGLTLQDSVDTALSLPPEDGFHVVLGHAPDFSLGQVDADLLVAGHTHGGQVQLPFVGPLLTLSQVPRSWASGVTEITPGKTLVVSRGIGMERGNAPRMRFLCRPQLVILDLMGARTDSP